ncbi:MAG TPA: cobaltochelatase subunit CobN, partial [Solirubrobacteraceae bacterium]|nr:cobaltochelatase subunit CobN [Solirubrobacteraceae bacterium]
MLRFVTTADTEILATAAAVERLGDDFPAVRCANPAGAVDQQAFVDDVLAGAAVVLCRILGGRRGWPEGFDLLRARCLRDGIPLLALGGEIEPDAEMTALSSAPAGAVAQAGEYLRHGDVANVEQLLRFLADTFLLEGHGFEPPHEVPDLGVYVPGDDDVAIEEALARCAPGRPTVGICFYRSHRITGNAAWVDELSAQVEAAGGNAIAVWSTTLRRDGAGNVPALALLEGHVDALLVTMLATGGSNAADAEQRWDAAALEALDVPVLQAVCATSSRAAWEESANGLTPLDAATQVAIPEFDGRLLGGVVSFKERGSEAGSVVGAAIPRYVADRERCARVARLAVRHARLRATPNADKKIALLLTSFPTKHARVGMAVGLDTPASALRLLDALAEAGYDVQRPYAHGDELMHALIAGGGHDPEFVSDEQLAAATLRLPVAEYERWYATLPESLRTSIQERWGPPPGDQFVHGGDFVVAALELGNVLVAIQPPRGYGDDPVGIYHDPELPPTHHYLACYRFLRAAWGADAIVHLGKHGTLEWLPGKMLALSAACAPDAAIGDIPLVYPFVVNDPGEGVQAKRRAHAVIVDHLVPPMMRAETYDELAELEALLDEYARLEILDPPKLPGLAAQIWDAIERANLQADLGVQERPDDLGLLVEHIDGYLCEVKDIQVKDGLHVLGAPPAGEQLRGLVGAVLRLAQGDAPGLRAALAGALGLDDGALATTRGADRLEEVQAALLEKLAARGWASAAVPEVCREVLGDHDADVAAALRFGCDVVVPRLQRTTDELDHLLAALEGRHVPAGPSGSPTRGRADVLPTGRNFYSVDPRALPSQLSWETGRRLADALLERHVADHGELPRMVGLVAWGTSAMRTQGDDAAEIFALLGVRPVWARESRR